MKVRDVTAWLISAALIHADGAFAMETAKFAPERGTIFPAERAMSLSQPCSRGGPENIQSVWTPQPEQIAQMEERLPKAYLDGKRALGYTANEVPNYYRQYAGYVIGGEKIVYVNAFAPPDGEIASAKWRTSPFFMCDDGAYFGVEYVVDTRTFKNFQIDGCLCITTERRRKP
jgi:hypothetical protein